ncbi:hypothetical protein Q5752_000076 [Cryptotrichosporon argae]
MLRLLLTLALAVPALAYSETFLGCYSSSPSGSTTGVRVTTIDLCASTCASSGAHFAWFLEGASGSAKNCYCSTTTSDSNWPTLKSADGSGSTSTSPACSNGKYYGMSLTTSFGLVGCYGTATSTAFTNTQTNQQAPIDCFATCASYRMALLQPGISGKWTCKCSNDNPATLSGVVASAQQCAQSEYWLYSHTAAASASALTKRQARERARRNTVFALCPAGKDACAVDGSEGYECIDTASELEHCGGCRFGQVDDMNATLGTE